MLRAKRRGRVTWPFLPGNAMPKMDMPQKD
jgi:hypothetical protein